jgi:hypothetical protein
MFLWVSTPFINSVRLICFTIEDYDLVEDLAAVKNIFDCLD